jgi:hypothetical protein
MNDNRRVILLDMDHSISDAAWRDHLIPEVRATGNWDKYYADQSRDEPIWFVAAVVRRLASLPSFDVVVLTTRPEKYRRETTRWLRAYEILFSELIMRPDDNREPSAKLKVDLIKARFRFDEIAFAIEDREEVVEAMRAEGISVLRPYYGRKS